MLTQWSGDARGRWRSHTLREAYFDVQQLDGRASIAKRGSLLDTEPFHQDRQSEQSPTTYETPGYPSLHAVASAPSQSWQGLAHTSLRSPVTHMFCVCVSLHEQLPSTHRALVQHQHVQHVLTQDSGEDSGEDPLWCADATLPTSFTSRRISRRASCGTGGVCSSTRRPTRRGRSLFRLRTGKCAGCLFVVGRANASAERVEFGWLRIQEAQSCVGYGAQGKTQATPSTGEIMLLQSSPQSRARDALRHCGFATMRSHCPSVAVPQQKHGQQDLSHWLRAGEDANVAKRNKTANS
jgi:hypothetical protein